jgi:hypothetical protein
MKNYIPKIFLLLALASMVRCADNSFEDYPKDDEFPFQLILDSEAGSELADAEDLNVEIKLADYLPDRKLPNRPVTLKYSITDLEGDMIGNVVIDKIVYEVELNDCTYEREIEFTSDANGLTGTINITADDDLGSIPESFEIIFTLPGLDETEGEFKVEFFDLQSSENIQLGFPNVYEYEVLDNDIAGEWETELMSSEEFDNFKAVFGSISPELEKLKFEDITGKVKAEFEFEEMKFVLELTETEEITTCEDGESETEIENKVIEIETEYDAEDGEIKFEGTHITLNDEGLTKNELDFIMEAAYTNNPDETVTYSFFSVIDGDNFSEGEELFRNDDGISFTFVKD